MKNENERIKEIFFFVLSCYPSTYTQLTIRNIELPLQISFFSSVL